MIVNQLDDKFVIVGSVYNSDEIDKLKLMKLINSSKIRLNDMNNNYMSIMINMKSYATK